MDYVVGFMFNGTGDLVLLIEKTKPDWQKGRLNGVGGKIEVYDRDMWHAMAREFKEETNIDTEPGNWVHVMQLTDDRAEPNHINIFFYGWKDSDEKLKDWKDMTEEKLMFVPFPLTQPYYNKVIHNLRWMLPYIHEYFFQPDNAETVKGFPETPLVVTFHH